MDKDAAAHMADNQLLARASASGKTILFGEHAVVYGYPGIAIPLPSLRLGVAIVPSERFRVVSRQVELDIALEELPENDPLRILINLLTDRFGPPPGPIELRISSKLPVAAGLGSGAALSVALVRAYAQMIGIAVSAVEISEIAFEIEKIYHGNPSGIDNSVIAFEKPIYYIKNETIEPIETAAELPILIADSGRKSATIDVVTDVRKRFPANRPILKAIGQLTTEAVPALKSGSLASTGALMNENQRLLRELTVSNPELDRIAELALQSGALGAKLTGAGRGGNMLILAADTSEKNRLREILTKMGVTVHS